ncbi:hypothetical protein THAOC_05382, partial [Thalassiosira oceanica]
IFSASVMGSLTIDVSTSEEQCDFVAELRRNRNRCMLQMRKRRPQWNAAASSGGPC